LKKVVALFTIEVASMTGTLNAYLIVQQQGPVTTAPAQAARQAAAQARASAQDAKELAEQIRKEVQAELGGVTVQPTPPIPDRSFTIRGPNGEHTVIGMPPPGEIIPPQAVDMALAFFFTIAVIIIGLPIARAFARRMDRKSGVPQVPSEVSAQLAHLNQAVDAIALEVERISEGQRFTTRLLSEQRDAARQTLPSGANR
jgi:hypothetical protein